MLGITRLYICDECHVVVKGTLKADPCSKNRELDKFHVSRAVMVIISALLLGKGVTVHTKQNGRPSLVLQLPVYCQRKITSVEMNDYCF
jgi:hypothetical protein